MIAVDTNILVYAHRPESRFHNRAAQRLSELATGAAQWAIAWPCVHEFVGVITHPRVFRPPTPLEVAIEAVDGLLTLDNLMLLTESEHHWKTLRSIMSRAGVAGPIIHDARIAAICIDNGVSELWSADRDFGRFPALKVVNPLVA